MNKPLLMHLGLTTLAVFAFSGTAFSQAPPTPATSDTQQEIIYTGGLFGYFRFPSEQSRSHVEPCQEAAGSREAEEFLTLSRQTDKPVLVGTGDNFAPRLEARMFAEEKINSPSNSYRPRNKEFYVYDKRWLLSFKNFDSVPEDVDKNVEAGFSTIPVDNVACFLRVAGFSAIVPGKHDFHFGPERVRELARLLASKAANSQFPDKYDPVQMLGANLVIKTTLLDAKTPAPDKKKWEWPKDFAVLNVQDGKSVFPWFSYVNVKLAEFPSNSPILTELKDQLKSNGPANEDNLAKIVDRMISKMAESDDRRRLVALKSRVEEFRNKSVYVCPASPGDRNNIKPASSCQLSRDDLTIRVADGAVIYDIALKPEREGRFSTVTAGKNYGLILGANDETRNCNDKDLACLRFSVFRPFLYYPNPQPKETDPQPFVFLDQRNIAIFGVVDQTVGEHIGVLNFSYLNVDGESKVNRDTKTEVSSEDPVPALRQQLDYFDHWYRQTHSDKPFSGLKILLAQMSPQNARLLAAKFPDFQIVISAADQQQSTTGIYQTVKWTPERHGTFLAVPPPAFVKTDQTVTLELGKLDVSSDGNDWTLTSSDKPITKTNTERTVPVPPQFQTSITNAFIGCLRPANNKQLENFETQVKYLTLCAMREQLGADVALIQQRDFYFEFTQDDFDNAQTRVQRMLDRILWKGDLLTLLYVPGSVLKKALALSDDFKSKDENFLSLADEKGRQFEMLGITKPDKDYLINEMPLDDKKLYAVATTDYIGAGDTGYPPLKSESDVVRPRTRPTQFPDEWDMISGVVCRRIVGASNIAADCMPTLIRDESLDRLADKAPERPKQKSLATRLWDKGPFKWPDHDDKFTPFQRKAEQHPIWILSLKNFSFSFTSLTKNLSDKEMKTEFAGTPTSGVTAKNTSTIVTQLDLRLSHLSHLNEFFFAGGIDYKKQSQGDTSPDISLPNNQVIGEVGLVRGVAGGRSQNRAGIAAYLHAETSLQRPIFVFTLNTPAKDSLKVTQNRNLLLLSRTGLRLQNRLNSFEVGFEAGPEINALRGYRFVTGATSIECLPTKTQTFVGCVADNSKPPSGRITTDSVGSAEFETRKRAGLYWKFNLSIPLSAKVKYELKQDADFFFNFSRDNTTDPRYRDKSKHSIKFAIFPTLSIGPSLQLLLYKNKVNGDFLFQKQLGIETSFSFDLFNRNERNVQIFKYKP